MELMLQINVVSSVNARALLFSLTSLFSIESCTVQGAIFKPCGATCVDTCSTRKKNLPVICSAFCKPGCACQAGQVSLCVFQSLKALVVN